MAHIGKLVVKALSFYCSGFFQLHTHILPAEIYAPAFKKVKFKVDSVQQYDSDNWMTFLPTFISENKRKKIKKSGKWEKENDGGLKDA